MSESNSIARLHASGNDTLTPQSRSRIVWKRRTSASLRAAPNCPGGGVVVGWACLDGADMPSAWPGFAALRREVLARRGGNRVDYVGRRRRVKRKGRLEPSTEPLTPISAERRDLAALAVELGAASPIAKGKRHRACGSLAA